MSMNYPNLELLEYKFLIELNNTVSFVSKFSEIRRKNRYARADVVASVFTQVWGSTCTAFDITDKGEAAVGGSAMTEAYTIVLHERATNIYGVFVDNRLCYIVSEPNEEFFEDLKSHNMKSKSVASKVY